MFESHTIIGHIGNIRESKAGDKEVVNVSVAVKRGKDQTTWYELALWEDQAAKFKDLNVEKGTLISAHIYGLYADAYLDKQNKPQATIKANVHYYRLLSGKDENK